MEGQIWQRTPAQNEWLELWVNEYQAKRLREGEDHLDYVRSTLLPQWDAKFGRPTGVKDFTDVS
jgi:hypothetical protein